MRTSYHFLSLVIIILTVALFHRSSARAQSGDPWSLIAVFGLALTGSALIPFGSALKKRSYEFGFT